MIITAKVNICSENISSDGKYVIKKSHIGTRILSFFVAALVSLGISKYVKFNAPANQIDIAPAYSVTMTTDDVNDMNIIINNDGCSETLFRDITDKLREDGVKFTITNDSQGINQDGSTVITLDQKLSSGTGTVIYAPYNNARIGHSDSLAIAMQSAFNQNGFLADEISCGQTGFQKDANGNVSYTVPTDAEKAIDEGRDVSLVTISLGTNSTNAEWIAKSIENGLARQHDYLRNHDGDTDLIYRASAGDSLDVVANYFGTSPSALKSANNMTGNTFRESQTIINPTAKSLEVFDENSVYYLDENKTKAY